MSRPPLPRGVIALGVVSLLTDVSTEMIHSVLPLVIVGTLAASPAVLGIIEGAANATAALLKLFSGALSDRIGKRRPLLLVGYGLSALSKPLFAMAGSVGAVAGARISDRVGKGIRGAPRDALIADITVPEQRGAAYGLRQSLDSVGAVLGPILALALIGFVTDVRSIFWFAALPGLASVAVIAVFVRDAPGAAPAEPAKRRTFWPVHGADIAALPAAFWRVVALAVVLNIARLSEAFLVLSSQRVGWDMSLAPLVMVVLNLVYTVAAWPFGALGDRWSKGRVLALSLGLLVAANLALSRADNVPWLMAGLVLFGLHLGAAEGLLSALVADAAPKAQRGTAFGLFQLCTAGAVLVAGVAAGILWTDFGPEVAWTVGAGLALAAGALVPWGKTEAPTP